MKTHKHETAETAYPRDAVPEPRRPGIGDMVLIRANVADSSDHPAVVTFVHPSEPGIVPAVDLTVLYRGGGALARSYVAFDAGETGEIKHNTWRWRE